MTTEQLIKKLPPLINRNSKGKLQIWYITIEEKIEGIFVKMYNGEVNGKFANHNYEIKEGKNIGKTNETTPLEQAFSECESKWNGKLTEGYKEIKSSSLFAPKETTDLIIANHVLFGKVLDDNIINRLLAELPIIKTDANDVIKPMLAHKFYNDKMETKMKFPAFIQTKLDGVRCFCKLANREIGSGLFKETKLVPTFYSREGNIYHVVDFIAEQLTSFFEQYPNAILDGELYIHGMILSNIVSAVKKVNDNTINLEYTIYDIILFEKDKQFERIDNLYGINLNTQNVKTHKTELVNNIKDVEDHCIKAIKAGYEGSIIRDYNAIYQFGKRTNYMLKLKEYFDGEFKILDIKVSDKNQAEYAVLVCQNDIESNIFDCTMQMNNERRAEIYNNKHEYIGKKASIKYYGRTVNKKPFHAKCVEIRDYE